MRELIVGFQTALDFWRSARIAEGGIAWLESEGRIYGARDLTLREQAQRPVSRRGPHRRRCRKSLSSIRSRPR